MGNNQNQEIIKKIIPSEYNNIKEKKEKSKEYLDLYYKTEDIYKKTEYIKKLLI